MKCDMGVLKDETLNNKTQEHALEALTAHEEADTILRNT